jgi:hypothetical protein
MDFDPRDYDSRDDDHFASNHQRGHRGVSHDDLDRDDDLKPSDNRSRDRDDDDTRELGRGAGDSRESKAGDHGPVSRDVRGPDSDRERPDRAFDPREPFTRHLHLPRGLEREIVRDRDRECTLRGSESRTLATVNAFRVVSSRDLRDNHSVVMEKLGIREALAVDSDFTHRFVARPGSTRA